MLNITTIQNGFVLNQCQYTFTNDIEVISESQSHVPTNEGTILLDLSCTINDVQFVDINEFITTLKGE